MLDDVVDRAELSIRHGRRNGAELVALTSDQLEMRIARPPRTLAEATSVAREHLAFCPDEVAQNAASLEDLTELLWEAPIWHFWWD